MAAIVFIILAILFVPFLLDILAGLLIAPWRRDVGGRADEGLVIFVESIRWLGVPWGMRSVAAGLRRGGYAGDFLYWMWHKSWRGWLVLPAIMAPRLLEEQARKLADFISARRREHPGRPLHVVGYSCGAFVMVRALELLPPDVTVNSAVTLAGAVSPSRDLSAAAARVSGKLIHCSSVLDWPILGLGTLLFGTADRKHVFSAGMVGLRPLPRQPSIVQVRWSLAWVAMGHVGGHFSAGNAEAFARHVAPRMGLAAKDRQ